MTAQNARAHRAADLRLYDYRPSANCLKVRVLLRQLNLAHRRIDVDIFGGDTLSDGFARLNPARRVPVVVADGVPVTESSAILWYLAHGSFCLPPSPLDQAAVVRWLQFEQRDVSHGIAGVRFRLQTGMLGEDDPETTDRRQAGRRALHALEQHLADRAFLVGERYSIADIANYAYVHLAPEAGYDLRLYPSVSTWLQRIAEQPGFANDLTPFPPTARPGRGLSIYG